MACQLLCCIHVHVGVGCGVLSAPDHGLAHQTGIAVGSSGNYSCQQGFTLSENETRVCLDSGDWTGGKPTCISTYVDQQPITLFPDLP